MNRVNFGCERDFMVLRIHRDRVVNFQNILNVTVSDRCFLFFSCPRFQNCRDRSKLFNKPSFVVGGDFIYQSFISIG